MILQDKICWLTIILLVPFSVLAQENQSRANASNEEIQQVSEDALRPSVKAYLNYLKQELTVTDAPESRREVNPAFIRHNFNRVSALRQFAVNLARQTEADFMPEMEAVTSQEFHLLFPDNPPSVDDLKVGEVYHLSYRFLGKVRNAEIFYIFARLDPYEEENLRLAAKKESKVETENTNSSEIKTKPDSAPKVGEEAKNKEETKEKTSDGNGTTEPKPVEPNETLTRNRFMRDLNKKAVAKPPSRTNPPN